MKLENAIEVKNITKKFKVYMDKGHTLKEKTLFQKRRKYEERNVLDGISFEVKKGEAIGLIGSNGCGKSTTLKLLTKIMYPDSGKIEMCGRVSSLIELGAGFHPDMSGRENIYINASIFGLTKKEIDERIRNIIIFSELEEFIDNPVRTYSSGMYMRLAFSVAINVDADILLIDEILAVGDVSFQAKCFNKLQEIKAKGVTIVIVSHSLGQIEQICERSVWIKDGQIEMQGMPREVHFEYLNYMAKYEKTKGKENIDESQNEQLKEDNSGYRQPISADEAIKLQYKHWGNGKVKILKICMEDSTERETRKFVTGEKMRIHVIYRANETIKCPVIGVGFWTLSGNRFYASNTQMDRVDEFSLQKGSTYEFIYKIESNPFLAGEYKLEVAIEDLSTREQLDYWLDALHFYVNTVSNEMGMARIEHTWEFKK